MSDVAEVRDRLLTDYGPPRRFADREPGRVLVFGHGSRDAAQAYATSNTEHFGHPTDVELSDAGWLTVVDLRPTIAAIEATFRESEAPTEEGTCG